MCAFGHFVKKDCTRLLRNKWGLYALLAHERTLEGVVGSIYWHSAFGFKAGLAFR